MFIWTSFLSFGGWEAWVAMPRTVSVPSHGSAAGVRSGPQTRATRRAVLGAVLLPPAALTITTGPSSASSAPEYLRPCTASQPSCVSSSAVSAPSKYLAPWGYRGEQSQAIRSLVTRIREQGGSIVVQDDGYVRAHIPYRGTLLSQGGSDDVEFLFMQDQTVSFRSQDSVSRPPPPFCLKPGCVNGPPNRMRMERLRDDLDWSPLETDEDKKWVQIMLH